MMSVRREDTGECSFSSFMGASGLVGLHSLINIDIALPSDSNVDQGRKSVE